MQQPYEMNIAEIKKEYTMCLCNQITPYLYDGIKQIYNFAARSEKDLIEKGKYDPNITNPGRLKIFQSCLKEIPLLNNANIEKEYAKIKGGARCADYFDDLVKATVKSHIVLLSCNNPNKAPDILKAKHHEKIDVKDFIHKCYIEAARVIYNNPELFWDEYPTLEIKRNQREAFDIIRGAIQEGIRKTIPMKIILSEYLANDYDHKENEKNNLDKIREMLRQDLEDKLYEREAKWKADYGKNDSLLEDDYDGHDSHSNDSHSHSNRSEDKQNNEKYGDEDKRRDEEREKSEVDLLEKSDEKSSSQSYSEKKEFSRDEEKKNETDFLKSIENKIEEINENSVTDAKRKTEETFIKSGQEHFDKNDDDDRNDKNDKNDSDDSKQSGGTKETDITGKIPEAEFDEELKDLRNKANIILAPEDLKNSKKTSVLGGSSGNKRQGPIRKREESPVQQQPDLEDRRKFFENYM